MSKRLLCVVAISMLAALPALGQVQNWASPPETSFDLRPTCNAALEGYRVTINDCLDGTCAADGGTTRVAFDCHASAWQIPGTGGAGSGDEVQVNGSAVTSPANLIDSDANVDFVLCTALNTPHADCPGAGIVAVVPAGGSPAFSSITSGTNNGAAAMVVGTGSSMTAASTGSIVSTGVDAIGAAPITIGSADVTNITLTSDGAVVDEADLAIIADSAIDLSGAEASGTLAAARLPGFTGGDVTSSAGSLSLAIGADTVGINELDLIDGDTPGDGDCITYDTGGANGTLEAVPCAGGSGPTEGYMTDVSGTSVAFDPTEIVAGSGTPIVWGSAATNIGQYWQFPHTLDENLAITFGVDNFTFSGGDVSIGDNAVATKALNFDPSGSGDPSLIATDGLLTLSGANLKLGNGAVRTLTWDASAGVDTVMTPGDGTLNVSTGALQVGGSQVLVQTDRTENPTASKIPLADVSNKLNDGWLNTTVTLDSEIAFAADDCTAQTAVDAGQLCVDTNSGGASTGRDLYISTAAGANWVLRVPAIDASSPAQGNVIIWDTGVGGFKIGGVPISGFDELLGDLDVADIADTEPAGLPIVSGGTGTPTPTYGVPLMEAAADIREEFCVYVGALDGYVFGLGWDTIGASEAGVSTAAIANRPCVSGAVTGATTTGMRGYALGSASTFILNGGETLRWSVALEVLADTGGEDYNALIGYCDTILGLNCSNGVYLLYDRDTSDYWQVCMEDGGTVDCLPSSPATAPTVSPTFQRVRFEFNAAGDSMEVYIDDVLVRTMTGTGLPDPTDATEPAFGILKESGTVMRTLWVDYMQFTEVYTSRR